MNRKQNGFNVEYTNIPGRAANALPDQSARLPQMNPNARSANPMRNTDRINPNPYQRGGTVNRPIGKELSHTDRIHPIKPNAKAQPLKSNQSRKKLSKRRSTALRDFLLGLVIGFAVFGTAAVFVVRAITELIV